ncbi:sialin-like isoform X1 [Mizuhopecten yessoensis]|uniref:Sialin n=1 Tax=Mizuhopecten yessoensis TaxID=6573 RepID=A0A210Q930_MIZYE|nr:sialin-like isoform X1 [Mizuhopecten yessoensis]OWF45215.1 Sialin [Mizuhopecten yessoensis]
MPSINRTDETSKLLKTSTQYRRRDVQPHKGYGARHTFTILSFIGYFHLYALRFNLSVAIVAMANYTDTKSDQNYTESGVCPGPALNSSKTTTNQAVKFDWDERTQGLILSSFFYGYVATQIPGGYLATKFGGKRIFGYGVLITAILTLVTPVVARVGTWALILIRIIEGLAEGMTFPAISEMQGKWTPEMERTTLPMIASSGAAFGNVIVLPVAGYLCDTDFLGGWPSVFYIFGGSAIIWFLFWHCLIFETPSDHTRISAVERLYIESTASVKRATACQTPWKAILTSTAMWAIIVTNFMQAWGSYITNTTLPTYMNKIQKFDITKDGLLMALPMLMSMFTNILGSLLADFLRRKRYLSTVTVRKLFNTLGLVPAALCLPFIYMAGCEHVYVVALIVVGNGMLGFLGAGVTVNLFDIGYNYSGILMGLANFSSNLPGVMSPYFVGLLTNNNETMSRWQTIFYVSMGAYIIGTIVFLLFAKGKEESWNVQPEETTEPYITIQESAVTDNNLPRIKYADTYGF